MKILKNFKTIIINTINSILNKYNKKIFILSNTIDRKLNDFAVKSNLGFWYVGNVFNSSDIAYGIANNGLVEKEETFLVKNILEQLMIKKERINFFDIGANTGYYGIFAAYLGDGNIYTYSFEPIIEHSECIKESIKLNHLDNCVRVFDIALGNENKSDKIILSGFGSSLIKEFIDKDNLPEREIKIRRLDDFMFEYKIDDLDFIKIDVEGYEYEVLSGALKVISNSLPVLFVEIAYILKNLNRSFTNNNFENTFQFLSKIGYQAFIIKNASIELYNNQKFDGVYMYLFLHQERHLELINYYKKIKF